ncbi:MAG: RagB/SusD family nutrient uptake outer membrane protein [Alistipes sp.]|nr:RagB/SusD family nutrient uptake outer membrane protein [Alistipes sp.]
MKFTKIFTTAAVALGAVVALSGCIRETFPKESAITESQLMTGDASTVLETLLPGIHAGLTSTAGAYEHTDYGYAGWAAYHDFECKNVVANGWLLGNNPNYNRFMTGARGYGYAPNSIMSAMTWMGYYPTIRSCNQIINLAGDNEDYAKYRGIAKAYRAMLYLDLARLFDPLYAEVDINATTYEQGILDAQGLTVPIVTEDTTEDIAKYNDRATREEMFNFIFADLGDALACLEGYVQEKPFYPTQAVVHGLYARAYMWLGCADFENDGLNGELPSGNAAYELAKQHAETALQLSGGAIMNEEQWTNTTTGFNTVVPAWMMAVVTSAETIVSNLHQHPAHFSPEALYGYSQYTSLGVSKQVYDNLSNTDFRKNLIKGPDTTLADFQKYTTIKDQGTFDVIAPYAFFKFRPGNGAQTDSTVGGSVALPIMRNEEMYFIQMEAAYHLYGDAAARDLLIQFMGNRDSNYNFYRTGEEVLAEIIAQKALEFWGEGIVMYDMKRLDMGVTCGFEDTNYYVEGRHNTKGRLPWWNYCVPQGELDRNEGIKKNNPDPSESLKPVEDIQ